MMKRLSVLACSLALVTCMQSSYATTQTTVKVKVFLDQQEARRIASSITDLTYIKPRIKPIQDPKTGTRFEVFIDNLNETKAQIIAKAIREKLHLSPEVVVQKQKHRTKPMPTLLQNNTSFVILKAKKHFNPLGAKHTVENLEQDFAEAPLRMEQAQAQAEALKKKITEKQKLAQPKSITKTAKKTNKKKKAKVATRKALSKPLAKTSVAKSKPIAKVVKKETKLAVKPAPKPTQVPVKVLAEHPALTYQPKPVEKTDLVQHLAKLSKQEAPKKPIAQLASVDQALTNHHHDAEPVVPLPSAKAEQPKHVVKHLWNVKNADIRSVIASVSEFTGRNFVVDPRVQGKVTILSKTPLTADEIYATFLSALQVNSYSAIEQGDIVKVVPTIDAKTMSAPVKTTDKSTKAKDSNLVRVISVKHVPVQQMIPVLRPLMPQWASLSTYVPSNKIILSGRNGNLDKLVKIIEQVDTDHLQQVTLIPIHYGQAEDISKTLKTLYTSYDGLAHRVAIAADDYSNSLLISGSPADRARIKSLVEEIDSPNSVNQNASTRVIYLKYLQAKDMVPILAGVAKSMFSGRVGTTIGSMTVENAERISIDSDGNQSYSGGNNKKDVAAQSKSETAKGDTGRSVEIIGEPNTNSIIINGPQNVLQTLRHVIRQIDIRPAQIIVEALIAEISEDEIDQLGIQWGTVVNNAANVAAAATGFQKNIGIITNHGFEDFQAILTMMSQDNKANILSTPSIMVLDNHKAHIAVGREVSIENSEYYNNGNQPTSTFTRKKVALALDVTPQINQGDAIRLLVSHANNSLQNANDTSGRPIFNVNEINTSVIINNGDVLVLGGLMKNEVQNNDQYVPILGHIPIIGRVFHDKNKTVNRRKLMVFLHPIIIKNKQDSQYYSNEKYDFVRQAQLNFMNQFVYHPSNKEYTLPQAKPKELPKPFVTNSDQTAHG